ncbi:MAG TPA: GNAT family N-acetyltransferase [Pyrinomonadaceae bacterium]|jgi:ribosomal protein S18 acetylase RimI-like enzyme
MFIRPAVKRDVPFVFRLQQRMAEEDGIYGFAAETVEYLEKAINPYFLIAESGGEIIGFINGDICLSDGLAVVPKDEKYLEIENLYVAPEFRKQGVGGGLVDEVLLKARKDGAVYATLYSSVKNLRGILRFYERHGFQSWSVEMFQKL